MDLQFTFQYIYEFETVVQMEVALLSLLRNGSEVDQISAHLTLGRLVVQTLEIIGRVIRFFLGIIRELNSLVLAHDLKCGLCLP